MTTTANSLNLDRDYLRARLYHGLKSLQSPGDTLQPRFLEVAVCQSFGFEHVGDSAYYADGITDQCQMSIKTRMLTAQVLKRSQGRDFQRDPDRFLGPVHVQKHDRWIGGLEIVQRRQQLDLDNDSTADAELVGRATLEGFKRNVEQSSQRYSVSQSLEVVGVHGYSATGGHYLVSLFWKPLSYLDPAAISWQREASSVVGYITQDGRLTKVCERINGNAKREATCFKEYKNLTKYSYSASIQLPIPDPWLFDQQAILAEIDLKEQNNDTILRG